MLAADGVLHRHPHGVLVLVPLPAPPLDEAALGRLLAEERALLEGLVEGRRSTWWAGRVALSRALTELGAPRVVLASDGRGAPVPPAGFSGSITHKPVLAGALAAPTDGAHVGVDVELLVRPRVDISRRVLTAREQAEAGDDVAQLMGRFSIKEAIYKAVDRFVGRYVGFHEAELVDLVVPPESSWEAPVFVETGATLTMAKGEGPFVVEASWARVGEVVVSTARVARRGA